MVTGNSETTSTADREIVISRVINARRELVWQVFTQPEHLVHWWGPDGFTNTFHEIDVRPGGVWRFVMHGPDGTDYENRIVFSEIVPPERLVYAHDSGVDGDPNAFQASVTLLEQGPEQTQVTLRSLFGSAEALRKVVEEFHAIEGAQQHLGRLADYVSKLS